MGNVVIVARFHGSGMVRIPSFDDGVKRVLTGRARSKNRIADRFADLSVLACHRHTLERIESRE